MILKVGIRGNGKQLGPYLHERNENDFTEILEVDGREDADAAYLEQVIMGMELHAELTRTDKAFFHAQINPAYGEDKRMTRDDWYKAADLLAEGTGYERQRRIITLHHKKGRIHAHVVWERYDHITGKMVDNKHSQLKADAMRPVIEHALGHAPTPRRNTDRDALKEVATRLWNETKTGADFIREARKAGYIVSAGTGSRPFMIVDGNGRSFDLVRQLQGVRTKEVRARLRHERLVTDKQAIEMMREQAGNSGKRGRQQMAHTMKAARDFAANRSDTVDESRTNMEQRMAERAFAGFTASGSDITDAPAEPQDDKHIIAESFADNKTSGIDQKAQEAMERQKIIERQEAIKRKRLQKKLRP